MPGNRARPQQTFELTHSPLRLDLPATAYGRFGIHTLLDTLLTRPSFC